MLITYKCQVKIQQTIKTIKYKGTPGILPERKTRIESFSQ